MLAAMATSTRRFALGLVLSLGVAASACPAAAEEAAVPAPARARRCYRPQTITVNLGAAFPVFLLYEVPGPLASVALAWPLWREQVQFVASADLGMVFADGLRRYSAGLGAGVRVAPGRRGPVWLRLGLGTTGWVERVGVILPERSASATDVGALLTANIALGLQSPARSGLLRGWELGLGWNHNLLPSPFYQSYTGTEAQPNRGTAMVWLGRQL